MAPRNRIDIEKYFSAMLGALAARPKARRLWRGSTRWSDREWTTEMTDSLAAAAGTILPKMKITAKGGGRTDLYGKHEYLTMDLTVYNDNTWNSPLLIVEHENSHDAEKLRYCAWKLLSVEAQERILVAYIDTSPRRRKYQKSARNLYKILKPVLDDHTKKHLTLFVGDRDADLQSSGWANVFNRYLDLSSTSAVEHGVAPDDRPRTAARR